MKVLILGDDSPGALMHSYSAAFRRMGAEVDTYCLVRAYRRGLPDHVARAADRLVSSWMLERFNQRLFRDLGNRLADLILVLKGARLNADTVARLKRATGAMVANYYPDDPFSEGRSNRLAFGPGVLASYDHCFTFAQHLMDSYRAAGVSKVSWLPFARDRDQHAPVTPVDPPEFDVMFAGNLDAERVRWLEPLARSFRLAVVAEHPRVPRYGTLPPTTTLLPAAYGPQLPLALARAAISLNVMRLQNRYSHNMRSFESPACGAFTLTQRTPELERMFKEDEEVAFVDSPSDIAAKVRYWLDRPADRQRIARAGYARVENDTYDERTRTIVDTLGFPHGA